MFGQWVLPSPLLVLRSLSQQDSSSKQEKGSMVDGPGNPGNPDSCLSGTELQDQHSSSLASSGISQVMRAELVLLISWGCLGWLCLRGFLSFPACLGKGRGRMSFIGRSSQCLSPPPLYPWFPFQASLTKDPFTSVTTVTVHTWGTALSPLTHGHSLLPRLLEEASLGVPCHVRRGEELRLFRHLVAIQGTTCTL